MSADDIARSIGCRVRAARKRLGLTRRQLAAAADVSDRYLNDLENGSANASIGILSKLAAALGVSFAHLVGAGDTEAGSRPGVVPELAAVISGMTAAEQAAAAPLLARSMAERRRASKGLALLGLRGAGKSTLGRLLAERNGIPFVSVTREVEAKAGMGLTELFNLGGPDAYRALECDVIAELAGTSGRIVLETAGGIVGNSEALDVIFERFRTVWLRAPAEEHLARVAGQGDMRPMHGNPKALEHVRALLAAREPEYARSECVLETHGRSIEACLEELESLAAPVLASGPAPA